MNSNLEHDYIDSVRVYQSPMIEDASVMKHSFVVVALNQGFEPEKYEFLRLFWHFFHCLHFPWKF